MQFVTSTLTFTVGTDVTFLTNTRSSWILHTFSTMVAWVTEANKGFSKESSKEQKKSAVSISKLSLVHSIFLKEFKNSN